MKKLTRISSPEVTFPEMEMWFPEMEIIDIPEVEETDFQKDPEMINTVVLKYVYLQDYPIMIWLFGTKWKFDKSSNKKKSYPLFS